MEVRFAASGFSRKAKRIAILSDTHGSLHPGVAELVRSCDVAVHAGDIGCIEVIRALRPRMRRVIAVRGNNDIPARWPGPQQALLGRIPMSATLHLPGGRLVVEHGHRAGRVATRHQVLRARYAAARLIVYGHSHRLCCDLDEQPWVVNPGAAGQARTFGGSSCLLLHVSSSDWVIEPHRFDGSPGARSGEPAALTG